MHNEPSMDIYTVLYLYNSVYISIFGECIITDMERSEMKVIMRDYAWHNRVCKYNARNNLYLEERV